MRSHFKSLNRLLRATDSNRSLKEDEAAGTDDSLRDDGLRVFRSAERFTLTTTPLELAATHETNLIFFFVTSASIGKPSWIFSRSISPCCSSAQ